MYAPNQQMMPTEQWLAPFEPTTEITGERNLLVVVGSATEVAAVRDIREEYPELPIVLWAHLLPKRTPSTPRKNTRWCTAGHPRSCLRCLRTRRRGDKHEPRRSLQQKRSLG